MTWQGEIDIDENVLTEMVFILLLHSKLFDRGTGGPQKYKWASLCTITQSRLSWLVNSCMNKSDFKPQMEVPSVSSPVSLTANCHFPQIVCDYACVLLSLLHGSSSQMATLFLISIWGNEFSALTCSSKFLRRLDRSNHLRNE